MRFEVIAAFVIGALLPVLETARRGIGHWTINFTTMFEDYLGGALLIVGAWAAYRAKSWGAVFLLLAWGSICGLMTSSFLAQVEGTLRQTADEPNNLLVVVVKSLLWIVSITSLVLSFRSAIPVTTKQMKLLLAILLALFSSAASAAQTNCLQTAREISPPLSEQTRRDFETKLTEARANFDKDPKPADNVIWLGRRTAYLGRYKEAIEIYTKGIEQFPSDARLYRHRGHRYITLRCIDSAIADFEKASKLIKGKPDEVEPDGLPNARNIPTSTLQSNIWYHLGLAHYLKGDFARALSAYREAEKVSKNADMLVATTHWLYMTLRRLGREQEAGKLLLTIRDDLEVIENTDYYKLIDVYKGKLKPAEVWNDKDAGSLSNATIGYGLGNWYLYNGRRAEAEKVFHQITAGSQWASFGYIAAESELKR